MYCKKFWIYNTQIWRKKIILDKLDLENNKNIQTLQEITEDKT